MHPLAVEILGTAEHPALRAEDPVLEGLLARARTGEGELLRASPRRIVLRLRGGGGERERGDGDWLLKVDRPRRPLESLRGLLRSPGGVREARLLRRLAARLPELAGPVHGEALRGGASLFARHFWQGTPLEQALPGAAAQVAAGLTRLHAAGWTDPDLLPGDLLLTAEGRLLPLDLGGARLRRGAARPTDVRRDLLLLLAGLPESLAAATVAAWAAPEPERVLAAAAALRARRLHRQSRRCLRRTCDFHPAEDGSIQRHPVPPVAADRELLLEFPDRRRAALAFRMLYEQELHDRPGPRIRALEPHGGGWRVRAAPPSAQ